MTLFQRKEIAWGVAASAGSVTPPNAGTTSSTYDIKVSTDGTFHVYGGFAVSVITATTMSVTGNLTVGGKTDTGTLKVSGATSLDGAVNLGGTFTVSGASSFAKQITATATVNVGGLLQATTTVATSALTPRLTLLEAINGSGTKIYIPYYVSLT